MRILYIAYSCSPINGSEDKVGWSVPLEMSRKGHEVFVVTKESHRKAIENWQDENTSAVRFFYVDIPNVYKKIFKGFLYSGRLNIWHNKALPIVRNIVRDNGIEIIHQITPVEYRSIGNYGKIKNAKFICGPLGGGESVPTALFLYTKGHRLVELLRNVMNAFYRCKYTLDGRFRQCDKLLFANKETKECCAIDDSILESELALTLCSEISYSVDRDCSRCTFLMAGRLIYRKGWQLLFDSIEQMQTVKPYKVRIVGDGPDKKQMLQRIQESHALYEHVDIVGKLDFRQMKEYYQNADVLVMPSIRETTGTVMYEAMSYGLPIIAMNRFGSGLLLNEDIGWTFDGNTREGFVSSLAKAMTQCVENTDLVANKRKNIIERAKGETWAIKASRYEQIYKSCLSNKG